MAASATAAGLSPLSEPMRLLVEAVAALRAQDPVGLPGAQALAKDLGADFVISGEGDVVEEVKQISGGGCQVVLDFVGELGVENLAWKMVRGGGQLLVIGYGGEIHVHGSPTLAQGLAAAGLVDRYHLLVFPVLLGSGKRLFVDGTDLDKTKLALAEHASYSNGITLQVYDVVR